MSTRTVAGAKICQAVGDSTIKLNGTTVTYSYVDGQGDTQDGTVAVLAATGNLDLIGSSISGPRSE